MARTFQVKTNVTVDAGTKGIRPDGSDATGRHWLSGSLIELTDPAEIAGLSKAGAIEPVGESPAPVESAPKPQAKDGQAKK